MKGYAVVMIHTGDMSHLLRDAQFDTVRQIIGEAGLKTHYVPGEHDLTVDDDSGAARHRRYAAGSPSDTEQDRLSCRAPEAL